jgi:hypothetical protein
MEREEDVDLVLNLSELRFGNETARVTKGLFLAHIYVKRISSWIWYLGKLVLFMGLEVMVLF